MLKIEERHFKIVKEILSKYPYTFYAFGSRTKKEPKRLSDLDLCFFESIPGNVRSHIEEDFEESDLPYKVDLVDWQVCDPEFRSLIQNDLVCIQPSSLLLKIEKNTFDYFTYLPKALGFDVLEESFVTMVNSGLGTSLFNIVCRTKLVDDNVEKSIETVVSTFQNQSFAWWLGPTSTPLHLEPALINRGFYTETTEYMMLCDLNKFVY